MPHSTARKPATLGFMFVPIGHVPSAAATEAAALRGAG
jgi:hypothetical protein